MTKRKKPQSSAKNAAATRKSSRPYPGRTLEESLKIPQAIREKNNGNPWAVEDVAQAAYGIKPSNNKFFYLAAAARDYGFTIALGIPKRSNWRRWAVRLCSQAMRLPESKS